MLRSLPPLIAIVAIAVAASRADAVPPLHLNNEVNALIDTVAQTLEKDARVNEATFSFGSFGSEGHPDSRYGPELRHLFEQRLRSNKALADRLIPTAKLKLVVNYDTADATGETFADKSKVFVLRITAKLKEGEKIVLDKAAEVNVTDEIADALGLTVAPPDSGNQKERNDAVRKAAEQNEGKKPADVTPTFQVKNRTKVGIPGHDRYFVEVLVKGKADGPAKAVEPTPNASGNAFVDVKPEQFYELVVYNFDEYACVAKITIDGQDAVNRFNADEGKYSGLLVTPEAKSGLLKGWLHTTKPREKEKDNVFAFAVKEYYPGAKDAKVPPPGEVGVITVQFALAWKEGTDRPIPKGRDTSRITEKGPPLQQGFKVEKYQHATFNETISIRYSPTAK